MQAHLIGAAAAAGLNDTPVVGNYGHSSSFFASMIFLESPCLRTDDGVAGTGDETVLERWTRSDTSHKGLGNDARVEEKVVAGIQRHGGKRRDDLQVSMDEDDSWMKIQWIEWSSRNGVLFVPHHLTCRQQVVCRALTRNSWNGPQFLGPHHIPSTPHPLNSSSSPSVTFHASLYHLFRWDAICSGLTFPDSKEQCDNFIGM